MAPSKNYQVDQIITYLTEQITRLETSLKEYESPIMQDMAKGSPHIQFEYIRQKTQLETLENTLLAIKTFTNNEPPKAQN